MNEPSQFETEGMVKHDILMPRGWRRVELPPQIAALPKDKKGFPIPYVAEWSRDESSIEDKVDDSPLKEGRGFWVRMKCICVIGEGEPILGHQCPERQRECMMEGHCQVCSEIINIKDEGGYYFLGGIEMPIFWEPPLHKSCAIYSLQVCPGITRRPTMSVHVADDYELQDKFEYMPPGEGAYEFAKNGEVPLRVQLGVEFAVMTYHGAIPIGGRRVLASEFLEENKNG